MSEIRSARIFISSTFRYFAAEQDLLVRQIFPALRARLGGNFPVRSRIARVNATICVVKTALNFPVGKSQCRAENHQ
jgi:hypothetical protein